MRSVLSFPAGRRAKWIVFGLWIVVIFAITALQLPTKFADAEKNESTSFLPGDAESTKALDVTKRLQGAETAQTVIVFRRDGGLTPADRAYIGRVKAQLD